MYVANSPQYLLQDDSLSVEPVSHWSSVLYLGGHHKTQRSQLSDFPQQSHQTITVEHLQLAVLVAQLHQLGLGLETAITAQREGWVNSGKTLYIREFHPEPTTIIRTYCVDHTQRSFTLWGFSCHRCLPGCLLTNCQTGHAGSPLAHPRIQVQFAYKTGSWRGPTTTPGLWT